MYVSMEMCVPCIMTLNVFHIFSLPTPSYDIIIVVFVHKMRKRDALNEISS